MRGLRAAIAAAAALGAAPAEAHPRDTFCAELQRVVEAARRDHGFAGLERSRAAPPRLGFAYGCLATGDERRQYWLCGQSFAPDSLSLESLAARTAACLPEAARSDRTPWRETLFTLPYAQIRISEQGGPGAHVGRIVGLAVEAVIPPQ